MKRSVSVLTAVFALTIFAGTVPRAAAEYPERAIPIINPQAPGGAHDAQGRAFAAVAEKYLGKPMVVVNKPGASTMIGTVAADRKSVV
jgi:tripartite-type tricarboxylate transporter receptor subunit TctC